MAQTSPVSIAIASQQVAAFGDAVEAEPVAAELQADDLLAAVGGEVDELEKPELRT